MDIIVYLDSSGRSPFETWFNEIDSQAAAKVTTAITRMAAGNLSNTKSVGKGVSEYRIDYGPGYRVYFGRDGDTLIILLAGGTKKRQQRDIELAHEHWVDYKRRKG